MSEQGPTPELGDRVTFVDGDGSEHFGIVLEPLPDDTFITVAATATDPRENYIGISWDIETSVFPHADIGGDTTTYAYKLGWSQ